MVNSNVLVTACLLASLSLLTSCKEEEFYEKDFIESVKEKHDRENPPKTDTNDQDSGDTTDGEDTNNNGGGDNGGGDNGGGDNGGGDNGGGDNGGGDNGGGDNGGGDNGGGDNGGGDNGGGDNGGGDNGGGDNGGGDNTGPEVITHADSFTQTEERKPMDILWVIDNSGSMQDEQNDLGENFDAFINGFVQKNIDFKMAITTTDTYCGNSGCKGKEVQGSMAKLNTQAMKNDQQKFMNDFKNLINVGIYGSGREKGIKASAQFTERYKNSFLRPDAYFAIVYVSDEADQSESTVEQYYNTLKNTKSNPGLLKAYSIVNKNGKNNGYYNNYDPKRYLELTTKTNSKSADIKENFYNILLEMGEDLVKLTEQYPLSKTPYDKSNIEVFVNGSKVTQWDYIEASNTIKFRAGYLPVHNDKIQVKYTVEK